MGHHMITRSKKNKNSGHHMITRSKRNKNNVIQEQLQSSPRKRTGRKIHLTLPFEIITEILSWASIECLIKCQSVCKQWYELIQDRNFIEKHMTQNIEIVHQSIYQKDINGENFRFIMSVDGLVLERGSISKKYRIRNSKMHRVYDLPETDYKTSLIYMSFIRGFGCYKVVSLFGDRIICGGIQVLTLGKEEKPTWKTIDTNIFRDYYIHKDNYRVLFQNGIGYFLRTISESDDIYEVICLNLETESFTSTTLPRSLFPDISNLDVMRWKDCFAVYEIENYNLNVMVLEDYKKGKWVEEKIVIPLKFLKENEYMYSDIVPYNTSVEDELIWFSWKWEGVCTYFSYCPKSEEIWDELITPYEEDYMIKESFVTFKGMRLIGSI